jgi:predicted nucleic acid-binding protein
MKLFVDANLLVAVVNKEYPLFTYAARILSLAERKNFELYTSPLCLAIAFYFSEKKSGRKVARKKIALLIEHMKITTVDGNVVSKAIQQKNCDDFEDGMEYFSAKNAGCEIIVTENPGDFHFGDLKVMRAEELALSIDKT